MIQKPVIVFGGSGRLGSEICRVLANVTGDEGLSKLIFPSEYVVYNADMIEGDAGEYIQTNILNAYSVNKTLQTVEDIHGEIYGVVNATYIKNNRYGKNPWWNVLDNDYLQFLRDNLVSTISLLKQCNEFDVQNIVLLSSIYGDKIPEDFMYDGTNINKTPIEYQLWKSSINILVRRLASERLHINAIAPGGIRDDNMDKQFLENYIGTAPFTTPRQVASMVKYLLSEDGMGINGQIITVDGGFSDR
jgi:NAD(P)-dependent dehydrogenase (short-subunit alcohol dehydrogenase family)